MPALTGQEIGRDGKIHCPLREERTPSLHVYDYPARGVHCCACDRGGTITELAAALYDTETRGHGLHDLRRLAAAARRALRWARCLVYKDLNSLVAACEFLTNEHR